MLDVLFGIGILADFAARLLVSRHRLRDFTRLSTWTDVVAIVSFLAPLAGEAGGFLRILRTLRLLRDYQMLVRLRADSSFFQRNEEVIFAVTNLTVFIFVMTAIVYETQKFRNDQITNYADALYFTVTALTTTGFGDITLPGTLGRMITVVIMIFGVTLFFNLARALLNPHKVRFPCPSCGLQRHDSRRRALQGLRRGAEYSRRGQFLTRRAAMPSATYALFRNAILAEQQVVCSYDGRLRELCPHIIGVNRGGEEVVLAWQFAGQSSGPLPQWRCLRLANVRDARAREGAGTRADRTGWSRPASAGSISTSTFTCASGGRHGIAGAASAARYRRSAGI